MLLRFFVKYPFLVMGMGYDLLTVLQINEKLRRNQACHVVLIPIFDTHT